MKKMKCLLHFFLLIVLSQQALAQATYSTELYAKSAFTLGGANSDKGTAVACDLSGNAFAAGIFSTSMDADPSNNSYILTGSTSTNNAYLAKYSKTGVLQWAFTITPITNVIDMMTDPLGNVIMYVRASAATDFDPTAGVSTIPSGSSALVKYSPAGSLLWVKSMGSGGYRDDYAGINVDASGNIIVHDSYAGAVDLDPSPTATFTISASDASVFFAKYDSNGNFVWGKTINNTHSIDDGNDVVGHKCNTDQSGNVFIMGPFRGSIDLDPSAGTYTILNRNPVLTPVAGDFAKQYTALYLAKYTPNGDFIWGFPITSPSGSSSTINRSRGMQIDNMGDVYISGSMWGTVDFDPSPAVVSRTTSSNGLNGYVAKYNSNGVYQWANAILSSTSGDFFNRDMAIDAFNNIYITGAVWSVFDFDPTTANQLAGQGNILFIAKYTSAGACASVGSFSGMNGRFVYATAYNKVTNAIYVTGEYSVGGDFDPSSGVKNLTSAGSNDGYLLVIDTNPDIEVSANSSVVASGSTVSCSVPLGKSLTTTYAINNTITVNIPTSVLNITGAITITGPDAADFTVNQASLNTAIPALNNSTFTLTFTPSALGTRTAVLTIPNNDPDEYPYIINLSGTGISATTPTVSITGPVASCPNINNVTYSVTSPVSGYSYVWNVPSNMTMIAGQGTSSIVVNIGPGTGTNTVSVTENFGTPCQGSSASLNVAVSTTLPPVSAITGPADFCASTSGIVYSVPLRAGSVYTWTVPAGFTITSGQGTHSITVSAGAAPPNGNITVTEVSCSSTSSTSKAITTRSYRLDAAGMTCGSAGTGYLTLSTFYAIRPGIIGLDFSITYDPAKITPTGLAVLGPVATSYGSYAINTSTPGIAYVSVYLNGAPSSVNFNGAGNIISLEFQQQAGLVVGTGTAVSLNNLEESTALNSVQTCSGFNATMSYTGSYNGQLYFRNTSNVIPGGSGQVPMGVHTTDPGCTSFSNAIGSVDASGILRYNSALSTTIQITRDVTGDRDVAPLNCSNVQSVINSTDRNMALQISNYTITNPTIYQLIAADVNMDGKVTAGDVSLISSRSVNAGYCEFPQSWNYTWNGTANVPASNYRKSLDWVFLTQSTLSTAPYTSATRNSVPAYLRCIYTTYVNPSSCNPSINATIVGILLGDVDGNWSSSVNGATTRTNYAQSVILDIDQAVLSAYNTYIVPVRYSGVSTLEGIDLSMDYNGAELDIQTVDNNPAAALGITWNDIAGEKLMISSYNDHGVNSTDGVLYITITTNGDLPAVAQFGTGEAYINGQPANFLVQRNGTVTNNQNAVNSLSVTVSPNPYEHQAIIKVDGMTTAETTLSLFDLSGRKVTGNLHETGNGEYVLDESMPAGMYVVEVSQGDAVTRVKVIKQ